ncbi:MAG: acylneuraminate cytidylyltransferase family protein [Haliscomenobacter sp.]|nr:acylneuraminate cytidylyltransferase family protein [Haliscomenobacter sp.]MBK7477468.1 acylneuraminate cytidylyltransferase family protein [Haliscomenobacter sp.]
MNTKRLVIVPGRGGSKRLPNKNCKMFAGKPLIQQTIDVIYDFFDEIIVTSDDIKILECVQLKDKIVLSKRPDFLASDRSKVIDTVKHYFDLNDGKGFNQIWLCLPTCPLKSEEDIKKGLESLDHSIDGVISITEYEFPPDLGLLLKKNGLIKGYKPEFPFATGDSRSQDQRKVYRPNGAYYGMWWDSFSKYKNFYRGKIVGSFMPRERSIDIDTILDFVIAETIHLYYHSLKHEN